MSYMYKVLKDHPVGFWPLDEASGSVAHDYSGCMNNGTYNNFIAFENIFPLVGGGSRGTLIDETRSISLSVSNNYIGENPNGSFGDKYSSDNDFSLEIWVYPKNITPDTTLFYDANSSIGIMATDISISFYVNDQYVSCIPDSMDISLHIVATYSKNKISLIVNGKTLASKDLIDFEFSNTSLGDLVIGPANQTESFIVDAPAIYRYELSEAQALSHFNAFDTMPPLQIVEPDEGVLFTGVDMNIPKSFTYSYPATKSLNSMTLTGLEYNKTEDYLTLIDGTNFGTATDYFYIPTSIPFMSSKIEWKSENGLAIFVSQTGEDGSYVLCRNGYSIPNLSYGDNTFNNTGVLYIKVEMEAVDSTIVKPRFKGIIFSLYTEKTIYADNYGDYISTENSGIQTESWDISAASENLSVLRRDRKAGIRPDGTTGFAINTESNIYSVEMIYHASDILSPNTLVSGLYSWDPTGIVDNGGVSLYINGTEFVGGLIDNIIIPGESYHIVLVSQNPISGKIYVNSTVDQGTWSNSGYGHGYSNIAIYQYALSESKIIEHYNLYLEKPYSYAEPVSIAMTETGVFAYNNDWQVVKSV